MLKKEYMHAEKVFAINPTKRKYLLFSDAKGAPRSQQIIDSLRSAGIPHEVYILDNQGQTFAHPAAENITFLKELCQSDLSQLFGQQPMGTQLLLAGDWKHIDLLNDLAIEAGFEEEDIKFFADDPRPRHIFCPRCYELSPIAEEEAEEAACNHCGNVMIISDFYSTLRKGFIGYAKH